MIAVRLWAWSDDRFPILAISLTLNMPIKVNANQSASARLLSIAGNIVSPPRSLCKQIAFIYNNTVTPGARELQQAIRRGKKDITVLSGQYVVRIRATNASGFYRVSITGVNDKERVMRRVQDRDEIIHYARQIRKELGAENTLPVKLLANGRANLDHALFDGADLSGKNLAGCSLAKARFEKAIMTCVNLEYAWLKHACLIKAILKNANMQDACLQSANLSGADLSGANLRGADLRGAELCGANLCGADLRGANLHGTNLTGAYLNGTDLEKADLSSAILRHTRLRQANLSGAILINVNLSGNDLTGAVLSGVNLSDRNLRNANLRKANLSSSNLSRADLCSANLSGTNLSGANLSGANLSGANLSGAKLSSAQLSGTSLRGIYLCGVNLCGTDLSGKDLRGMRLSGANLSGANLSKTDLRGTNLSGANLYGANLSYANLHTADLTGAYLNETDLQGSDLRDANLEAIHLHGVNLRNSQLDNAFLTIYSMAGTDLGHVNLETTHIKLLPADINWNERNVNRLLNHYDSINNSLLTTLHSISPLYDNLKVQLALQLIYTLINAGYTPARLLVVALPMLEILGQPPYVENPTLNAWVGSAVKAWFGRYGTEELTPASSRALLFPFVHSPRLALTHSDRFAHLVHTALASGNSALADRAEGAYIRYLALPEVVPYTRAPLFDRLNPNDSDELPQVRLTECDEINLILLPVTPGGPVMLLSRDAFAGMLYPDPAQPAWNHFCLMETPEYARPVAAINPERLFRQDFPLFLSPFLIEQKKNAFIYLLDTLDLKAYRADFDVALRSRGSEKKLVSTRAQTDLHVLFSHVLRPNENWGRLTAAHTDRIKDAYRLGVASRYEQAQHFLCLSALFARLSSAGYFGMEYESPVTLRVYAHALMLEAAELDNRVFASNKQLSDWQDRFQNRNKAFDCTAILSDIMTAYVSQTCPNVLAGIRPAAWT